MNIDESGRPRRRVAAAGWFRAMLVAAIAALAVAALSCGDEGSTLEDAQESGRVRIGFANEAPYGFANEAGEVTGEAPEVARAVLAEMGITEIDPVVVPFGSLIPGLQSGRFDIIAAGMFINPDRCGQVSFSDPDYCIPQAFGVAAGNPLGLNNYDDVAANPDARLGVIAGAVEEGYALAAGVSSDQIQTFDDVNNLPEALLADRIDAFAATTLSVRAQIDRVGSDDIEATAGFAPIVDGEPDLGCGGYGFRTDDEDFRDAFNEILADMKANDQIVPITEEFGFGADEIGAAKDITAADLCSE